MKLKNLVFILISILSTPLSLMAGDGTVTLIHIGDIHGHLIPRPNMRKGDPDYGKQVGGLAYLYDQIKKIRQQYPNSLLINTGDTIQGSAEALYSEGQVIVDMLNQFEIDAFVPGNWDFLYGTERFRELFAGDKPKTNWHAVATNLYYATLYDFPLSRYADKAGQRVLPFYLITDVTHPDSFFDKKRAQKLICQSAQQCNSMPETQCASRDAMPRVSMPET